MSMAGGRFYYWFDQRVKQIKQEPKKYFGGVNVIMFGDMCQITPVGDCPSFY